MALPKLETATYTVEIPSTQKTIEFRPFLVKEEKILIQAQESGDTNQIIKAIKDIISVCTFKKVDPNELTLFDLEFVFLQLRARSVGETVDFKIKCSECDRQNIVTLDLTEVQIKWPEKAPETKLKLSDTIGVILRPIRVKDMTKVENNITESIIASIEAIFDEEDVYPTDEASKRELINFVDSLSHSHLEAIQEYIENQPKLEHVLKYNCTFCGHANEYVLSGLADFFI